MTKEKVIEVGKCFTRILRDHMNCKKKVNQTTKLAMTHMKELLEKETEMELKQKQLEAERLLHLEKEAVE